MHRKEAGFIKVGSAKTAGECAALVLRTMPNADGASFGVKKNQGTKSLLVLQVRRTPPKLGPKKEGILAFCTPVCFSLYGKTMKTVWKSHNAPLLILKPFMLT